jgi:hypothetical protein
MTQDDRQKIRESAPPQSAKDARELAWAECRADREPVTGSDDWTVGEVGTYRGFFYLGWEAARLAERAPSPSREAAIFAIEKAEAKLDALCNGQRWRMSIPVRQDDPDIVIGQALMQAKAVIISSPPSAQDRVSPIDTGEGSIGDALAERAPSPSGEAICKSLKAARDVRLTRCIQTVDYKDGLVDGVDMGLASIALFCPRCGIIGCDECYRIERTASDLSRIKPAATPPSTEAKPTHLALSEGEE